MKGNDLGGPIPHNMARPLMVRQPYSVAVLSTGGIQATTSAERYCNEEQNITFFKKLIGVTTCNIVGTLYW